MAKVFTSFTCFILFASTALLSSFYKEDNCSLDMGGHVSNITQLGNGDSYASALNQCSINDVIPTSALT